jgi:ubiquinone/menaquinone biosynthesis C-methylase UbiE
LKNIIKIYSNAFRFYGNSPKAVQWPKGRQEERFNALFNQTNLKDGQTILDFGCGLADLYTYLININSNIVYTGVDIVQDFLNANKTKFNELEFINSEEFLKKKKNYDYIVVSGAFNLLFFSDVEKHK